MAEAPPNAVPVASLGPGQLQHLRNQLAQDVEELVSSHAQLGVAATRYSTAARAVETLAESKKDQALLLPLTQSLYVKGKVAETEKVLVNIGTDYFVEMSTEQATAYCRRKTLFLQKEQQTLQKMVQEKRGALNQVTNVLQEKIRELQSTQPGSSKSGS